MSNPITAWIESRASTNRFDPSYAVSDAQIAELIRLATRGPARVHRTTAQRGRDAQRDARGEPEERDRARQPATGDRPPRRGDTPAGDEHGRDEQGACEPGDEVADDA